ncbi:hypothetical protein MSG28_009851 [Choristoneura fumiferana]|uniref:Uncharacterized protein n=1 Tax=Choristoneura fumiferana TaxID=7141 RepID=A0ACC0JD29_CHOFU|nr:hypothetical protein MSG28_009851 [Choristoneura fumiferana]
MTVSYEKLAENWIEIRQLLREKKRNWKWRKKMASQGNNEGCKILAKQLVQLRKQKTRIYAANSKISSVQMSNKAMGANIAIAGAMGTTAKTMGNMNKVMNPHQIAKDMDAFKQANAKLDMTDEMISDTLDDIMDESGDEEETEGIVNKVLDEIGIEISGKEQEQRDMLSSQDGDTCETHDQFYRDHKLLLVLFRALAVMPITRSRPGRASGMFGEVNFAIPFSVAEPVRIAAIPWQCVRSDVFYILPVHVAAGVQDTLLSIDVLAVDRPCQKEAIEMNPAVVSLKGYAHVNRELLTSAISMIAIYLVVLLQFKISLPKDIPGT